ncbi:tyrosine-type recombinase/integrase [Acetobacter musti]|uniref:Tyrosine-type recombinase/integrase n=1 Tax=Acetobacter musti TaxID=864732 RepID=A0ABX0JPZ0_9PROT|nr:tyrosine-type recombinase/integrase [Acetobacter musti]NHN84168.1 tyrosine-type recombinase/integrase [Acetobacter musti]
MRNLLKRGQTYYARFIVPQDRWEDAGKATGTESRKFGRTPVRMEVVRTLGTKDHREALRRRDKALEAIRRELDSKLVAAGLAPLHGDWEPPWPSVDQRAVEDGLAYRQDLEKASGEYIARDDPHAPDDGAPDTQRELLADVIRDQVEEAAEAMPPADGARYYRTTMGVIDGTHTPLGGLLDRWGRERDRSITDTSRAADRAAFNHFAEYVCEVMPRAVSATGTGDGSPRANDAPLQALRLMAVQQIEPSVTGGFVEWLLESRGLRVKTAQGRVSPLKVFWQWCIRKHVITGPNPWTGATEGMKKQAQRVSRDGKERREFTEDELVKLLSADPDEGKEPGLRRRWAWGSAISDLMRLALLTGARENELCSLTVGRIINRDQVLAHGSLWGAGQLWGISVTDAEAKTTSSVRRIPLHPLARRIIERRLGETDGSAEALLFPECKPGGAGNKHSYYFAKRFTEFRRRVLGAEESDGATAFHSFRKNFGTYMHRASVAGVPECQLSVVQRLMGHKLETITQSVYTEKDMAWPVYERAIMGMVDKGMPEAVRECL